MGASFTTATSNPSPWAMGDAITGFPNIGSSVILVLRAVSSGNRHHGAGLQKVERKVPWFSAGMNPIIPLLSGCRLFGCSTCRFDINTRIEPQDLTDQQRSVLDTSKSTSTHPSEKRSNPLRRDSAQPPWLDRIPQNPRTIMTIRRNALPTGPLLKTADRTIGLHDGIDTRVADKARATATARSVRSLN